MINAWSTPLGMVFGLATSQTEGFIRSLLALLNLKNAVQDHTTISRRKAKLGKVALGESQSGKPIHILIDSSGLSVHVGQFRQPPKNRDYRKIHICVDEKTGEVVAAELTSKSVPDTFRVKSLLRQVQRPLASARADAGYDAKRVYEAVEHHYSGRSPRILIPPCRGAVNARPSASTRQCNRHIRARARVGKRAWHVQSGYSQRSKVETTFYRYKTIIGPTMQARKLVAAASGSARRMPYSERNDRARNARRHHDLANDHRAGRASHARISGCTTRQQNAGKRGQGLGR